jgi:hypothetical protein
MAFSTYQEPAGNRARHSTARNGGTNRQLFNDLPAPGLSSRRAIAPNPCTAERTLSLETVRLTALPEKTDPLASMIASNPRSHIQIRPGSALTSHKGPSDAHTSIHARRHPTERHSMAATPSASAVRGRRPCDPSQSPSSSCVLTPGRGARGLSSASRAACAPGSRPVDQTSQPSDPLATHGHRYQLPWPRLAVSYGRSLPRRIARCCIDAAGSWINPI